MTARALALEAEARKLPATERERSAEQILVQMAHEPLSAVDEAWIEEAEKRFGAWKRKMTNAVAARTALREIRKELRRSCIDGGSPAIGAYGVRPNRQSRSY